VRHIQANMKMGNMLSMSESTCDTQKPFADEKKGAQCREKHMPKNFVVFRCKSHNYTRVVWNRPIKIQTPKWSKEPNLHEMARKCEKWPQNHQERIWVAGSLRLVVHYIGDFKSPLLKWKIHSAFKVPQWSEHRRRKPTIEKLPDRSCLSVWAS